MITEGLQSNKTLTKLDVSGCGLSVKGTVRTIQDVLICFNEWWMIGVNLSKPH